MKAIVQGSYGPPQNLRLLEVPVPEVGPDDVLVRVRAASVHPDIWHVLTGRPRLLRLMGSGVLRPRTQVPGTDLAGEVESVGAKVTRFGPGDAVFGESVHGHQWHNGGAFAEYAAVPASELAPMPANVSFEQAATVPTSGLIALRAVRGEGRVGEGQRVLVNGAGGGVGLFAVQLAKAYGAEVTAVDNSAKQELLRSVGADRVVDYTREDFTEEGRRYDVMVDIPGNRSIADCVSVLEEDGTYVLVGHDNFGASGGGWIGNGMARVGRQLVRAPFVRQLRLHRAEMIDDPLGVLAGFIEAGSITPVVGCTYPLAETVVAIRELMAGSPRGRIVITV